MNKLTGRTRFRAAEIVGLGVMPQTALVWQVETVRLEPIGVDSMVRRSEWRDGQVEDLCEINALVYSHIHVNVEMPVQEELPGEGVPNAARKLH